MNISFKHYSNIPYYFNDFIPQRDNFANVCWKLFATLNLTTWHDAWCSHRHARRCPWNKFYLFCAYLWIKTLRWSLMVPSGGKFILKFWKAICFRFSGITADIVSEIFPVWKVRVSPSECSNIGKLFEWKILLLCCCQGGNYKSFWLSAWNWNLQ